jgi:hypothetical protein
MRTVAFRLIAATRIWRRSVATPSATGTSRAIAAIARIEYREIAAGSGAVTSRSMTQLIGHGLRSSSAVPASARPTAPAMRSR